MEDNKKVGILNYILMFVVFTVIGVVLTELVVIVVLCLWSIIIGLLN